MFVKGGRMDEKFELDERVSRGVADLPKKLALSRVYFFRSRHSATTAGGGENVSRRRQKLERNYEKSTTSAQCTQEFFKL